VNLERPNLFALCRAAEGQLLRNAWSVPPALSLAAFLFVCSCLAGAASGRLHKFASRC